MKNFKNWMAAAGVGLTLMTATMIALPTASANTLSSQVAQVTTPNSGSIQQVTPPSTGSAPSAQSGQATAPRMGGRDFGHRGGPIGGNQDEYLAQALNITVDELATARQTAYEAAVDQALADGLITQAQADQLKANQANGDFGPRGLHLFGVDAQSIDMKALLADALGITTDQLAAAETTAHNLAVDAAVADGSITQAQADQMKAENALRAYLDEQDYQGQVKSLYENLVRQAATAGVITQAQADAILANNGGFGHGGADFGRGGMDFGRGGADFGPMGGRGGQW